MPFYLHLCRTLFPWSDWFVIAPCPNFSLFVKMLRTPALARSAVLRRQLVRGVATGAKDVEKKGTSADWLLNLSATSSAPEVTSDAEAQQWLDAMAELRQKWRPEGQPFDVDRAFAPEGMEEEYDFWAAAEAELDTQRRSQKYEGTPEQIAEAEALQDVPIPEKRDMWMNLLVNKVMRKGEKAKAYRIVNRAMYLAFLKLREDPVGPLLATLDHMAPLAQLHRIGDGGARAELFPVPYSATRRIALAWSWVVEASQKRQSRDFAVRLGEEIVATIEGKSPGFAKSEAIHKTAVANRSIAEEVQQGRWKR